MEAENMYPKLWRQSTPFTPAAQFVFSKVSSVLTEGSLEKLEQRVRWAFQEERVKKEKRVSVPGKNSWTVRPLPDRSDLNWPAVHGANWSETTCWHWGFQVCTAQQFLSTLRGLIHFTPLKARRTWMGLCAAHSAQKGQRHFFGY